MPASTTTILLKRLFPLYVALFFQGVVLWYALEKLFMRQIGFDDAGIGTMVAGYSAIMLLIETPSGILADRWSRKGVLVLSCVLLAASSIVGGMSESIPMYLACAGLWGMFFAMYSGTYDSIIYDTLLETAGTAKDYEKYYGRAKVVDSAALVLGSLVGGLVASQFGIEAAYFWTVPLALASGVALLFFKEPKLHKKHADVAIVQHVKRTFGAVLKKGEVFYILVALVIMSALSYGLFEFSQLWWIALAMPLVWFGTANGALLATIGLGGLAASRLQIGRYRRMLAILLLMLAAAVVLALWRQSVVVVICQVVLSVCLIGVIVVLTRMLHDHLPSQVRAGAASAVSTMTRVVLIPFSLLFGFISRELDVFAATWVFVILIALAIPIVVKMFARKQEFAVVSEEDGNALEEYRK
jgi:MFS family permease